MRPVFVTLVIFTILCIEMSKAMDEDPSRRRPLRKYKPKPPPVGENNMPSEIYKAGRTVMIQNEYKKMNIKPSFDLAHLLRSPVPEHPPNTPSSPIGEEGHVPSGSSQYIQDGYTSHQPIDPQHRNRENTIVAPPNPNFGGNYQHIRPYYPQYQENPSQYPFQYHFGGPSGSSSSPGSSDSTNQ